DDKTFPTVPILSNLEQRWVKIMAMRISGGRGGTRGFSAQCYSPHLINLFFGVSGSDNWRTYGSRTVPIVPYRSTSSVVVA
ncbi:hypothetical protein KI387_044487, partial [Taxus chinensis]